MQGGVMGRRRVPAVADGEPRRRGYRRRIGGEAGVPVGRLVPKRRTGGACRIDLSREFDLPNHRTGPRKGGDTDLPNRRIRPT